jgi:hypothetical protein
LLKAEALGGLKLCPEEIFSSHPLVELLKPLPRGEGEEVDAELQGDGEEAAEDPRKAIIRGYRRALGEVAEGRLPGLPVIGRFMRKRGNALSVHEIRTALSALKGTDLERAVLAEARQWAADQAEQVRAEQRRLEEAARQAAEEAERKRQEAERRAAEAEERRRQAEARAAEEAERCA